MKDKLISVITFVDSDSQPPDKDYAQVPAFFAEGMTLIVIPKSKLKLVKETKSAYIFIEPKEDEN